jgi:diguanylate cyclase (GGDEF)-like protein
MVLPDRARDGSAVGFAIRTLLIAVTYVAAGQLSLLVKHPLGGISPLWLPSAVSLGAVMLYGLQALPGIALGSIGGSLYSGYPVASALTGAGAGLCEVLVAHLLLSRGDVTLRNLLDGLKPMLRFVLSILPAALVGAVLGTAGLVLTGGMGSGGTIPGIALWLAGDYVGMLLTVPLLAAWLDRDRFVFRKRACVPAALAIMATTVVFFLTDVTREGSYVFAYVVFPLTVWCALWASPGFAVVTHVTVAGLAIAGTALGLGPYAVTASPTDVGLLQAFVVALVATSLLLEGAMEDRRRSLEQVHHQALHDQLTGLRNRRGMHASLDAALAQAKADGGTVGLFFVDIDDFKTINDTVGHDGGDHVLAEVAERFRAIGRAGTVTTRPGGDEFVAVMRADSHERLIEHGERIVASMHAPMLLGARAFRLTCSVGLARFPDDGDDPRLLMRYADMAMYAAKRAGKNQVSVFTPELREKRMRRVEIENALRGAIDRGEFTLAFQPQFDMVSRELVGAEALLRWRHHDLGSVPPDVFVPVAEELGIVQDVGRWVFEAVCRQSRAWTDAGLRTPRLAVNLSPQQLGPKLAEQWQIILAETHVAPNMIEAELTETCVMRDERGSAQALTDLTSIGVRVALDDFGTGQSSLSLLTKLPLSSVKIDQSFVHQVGKANGAQIVSAIVSLARQLGLQTTAEGVESQQQETFLRDVGCDAFQGFLASRPLPPDQFARDYLAPLAQAVVRTTH